jgi:hypothetical protein
MLHLAQLLMALPGGQAKADAMLEKLKKIGECDVWVGTITVWFFLTPTNPNLDRYKMESGGGSWFENHKVQMTTHVQTYVLKGEDLVTLDFPEVQYGRKDREDCHSYFTHAGVGSGSALKFDGRYDGYTFTVGDLQLEGGGSATITYGVHRESYDSQKGGCVVEADQTVPAPNYTTILRHGLTGSPPITIQEMLQGGDNNNIRGGENISNDAFELGIYPFEKGRIEWSFIHAQKYLPPKK